MTTPPVLNARNYLAVLQQAETDRGREWVWFIQKLGGQWIAVVGTTPEFPAPIPVKLR